MLLIDSRCLFILLCLGCWNCSAAGAGGSANDVFDHLMLTREWPFSFCSVESCTNKQLLQTKFNIHGLWAESQDKSVKGEPPVFCNFTFNDTELAPLKDDLQKNWMDLKNPKGSAKAFWREEFKKHGSCVATCDRYNSTYLYFLAALQLHEKYNLMDMLAKGGVQPGPGLIDATTIRNALQASFGFNAGVRCSKVDNQAYLYELRLCFTKDLQPMNCDDGLQLQVRQHRPWGLGRFMEAAAAFLRGALGWEPPRLQRQQRQQRQPSGTYECHAGEMVLMPVVPASRGL